ncbi:unnamed protein product, partial [marine sediment metagenome]
MTEFAATYQNKLGYKWNDDEPIPTFPKTAQGYIDAILYAGAIMSAPHQTAFLDFWDSCQNGTRNFMDGLVEFYAYYGEIWDSGIIGLKQDYNLSLLEPAWKQDDIFTSNGLLPLRSQTIEPTFPRTVLETGIDIEALNITDFGIGGQVSAGVMSSRDIGFVSTKNSVGECAIWANLGDTDGNLFDSNTRGGGNFVIGDHAAIFGNKGADGNTYSYYNGIMVRDNEG